MMVLSEKNQSPQISDKIGFAAPDTDHRMFEKESGKMKLNEPERLNWQRQNSWQQAKQVKLYSDPLEALLQRTLCSFLVSERRNVNFVYPQYRTAWEIWTSGLMGLFNSTTEILITSGKWAEEIWPSFKTI